MSRWHVTYWNRGAFDVSRDYEWAIGMQASFLPVSANGDPSKRISGKIIEVRDDSPWDDEEHCRIVIDAGTKIFDVAKERVELE